MLFSTAPSVHQRACTLKQDERRTKIASLPPVYSSPLSLSEEKLHALSLSQLVSQSLSGVLSPSEIMLAYAKKTLQAQRASNCLTDIMFDDALSIASVANWAPGVVDSDTSVPDSSRDRLLMGVPVSIKDTFDIVGHDTTVGFSRRAHHPATSSSSIVRLLQDSGALIHAKTTVPTGLLGVETVSDLFGRTTNPYNHNFSAGASTGGGAALLASGGSKVDVGTDIGGSVRIPAHFCGLWSLKGSAGRFPVWGSASSTPGLEVIPTVASPMAATLDDLAEFWQRIVQSKPWQYDFTCIPLPWQQVDFREEGRKLKWGIMWDDGTVSPTPACKRALSTVATALQRQGHEVVDFSPPDLSQGLSIGYQLLFGDAGTQIRDNLVPGESLNPASQSVLDLLNLPRLFKRFLAFITRFSDPQTAELLSVFNTKTVMEERALIVARDEYRAAWHRQWIEEGLDFVLTVPYPLPAIAHGDSLKTTLMSTAYTFIFSILDYAAGVIPVTFVDKAVDALPLNFTSSPEHAALSTVGKGCYSAYDAERMHGLPVGVQIVGRRLEEEKVLEGMKVVEMALREQEVIFSGKVAG